MASIIGRIILPSGAPYVGSILFRSTSTPMVDPPSIISTADVTTTTDALGNISLTLLAGIYKVYVGASRVFEIEVPDEPSSEYSIINLVRSKLNTTSEHLWWGGTGGGSVAIATTTEFGVVKIYSSDPDPVVPLVGDCVMAAPANANFRFKNGVLFQLFNQTTGKYHTIWLIGAAGLEQPAYGPGED